MALSKTKSIICGWMLFILLSMVACTTSPTATPIGNLIDQSKYTWTIQIDRWEISDELNATQSVMQYNGEATSIQYVEKPSDGHTFLLMRLTVEKQVSGPSTFKWDHLYVVDVDGNKTYRHLNDTFLVNYNLLRIKSTDLVIGSNEGYLCFEIPKSAQDSLTLTYESDEGVLLIPLVK